MFSASSAGTTPRTELGQNELGHRSGIARVATEVIVAAAAWKELSSRLDIRTMIAGSQPQAPAVPYTTELSAIVQRAYAVFDDPRPVGALRVCQCSVCVSPEAARLLVETPLREISWELLAEYTNSAHEWDEVAESEFRYFLPRYLELIALNQPPDHLGLQICLRRLANVDWRNYWVPADVAVLDAFFVELLLVHLQDIDVQRWPVGWRLVRDIVDSMTLVVTAHGPLDLLLDAWQRCSAPGAGVHLAALRMELVPAANSGWRPSTAFLDDFESEALQIGAFVSDPKHKERLESVFFSIGDERLEQIVSDALTLWN